MTSQINPNNIDGTYPVAGQDNDSQGFRDNFTSTKTNFQYAAAEITDLQSKAVLKSALTGTTLNNNMGGSLLIDAQLQDMSETRVALGTVNTGNTATIDYSAGPYYTFTTGGNVGQSVSLAFTNFSTSGTASRVRVQANVANTGHSLQLPSAVNVNNTGIQGLSGNTITFGATGVYEFEFETVNGGTNISMFDLNRPLNVYTNPLFLTVPQLLTTGNIDLNTTTTVVTSNASLTPSMADGSEGQIKVITYGNATIGDCLITVANAAWGGNSTVDISDTGIGATFQYVNGQWFCIGNNGATFD